MIDKLWEHHRIKLRPFWLKLTIPILFSAGATWLTLGPLSRMGQHSPFLLFFLAIYLSACYGGWWSALICTITSTIAAIGFIYPQHNSLPDFYCSIMFFLLLGLMLTFLFRLIGEVYDRLEYSEARFRGMIEKSAEGFLLANADGMIKYVAPTAANLLGYTVDDMKNTRLTMLIHPDELRYFELRWHKLQNQNGGEVSFKQRLKNSKNNWLWIEGTANNLLNDPQVQALVFHYRDITERVNKEKQQEDFVHMASHELKTPITALKGFAQLIRKNHEKEGRNHDRHMLDRMDQQLNKMLNLIDGMLNMTRIRTGELHYHFSFFDLQECVSEVVEAIQSTTHTHKLILAAGPSIFLKGDRDKIGQVINNLVTNAIKYSPGKDIVEIKLETIDSYAFVKVRDYGLGIPKKEQQKIFTRFYRVDSPSTAKLDGLGLGLYIATEIIKHHEGKMGIESEDGQGCEFWFCLPLQLSVG
jgi:PAS domain S-box-containing protein